MSDNNNTNKNSNNNINGKHIEINYGPYLIYFLYMVTIFIFLWLTIGLGPQGDYIFTEEIGTVISFCSWCSLILTLVSYELSPILNPKRRKK